MQVKLEVDSKRKDLKMRKILEELMAWQNRNAIHTHIHITRVLNIYRSLKGDTIFNIFYHWIKHVDQRKLFLFLVAIPLVVLSYSQIPYHKLPMCWATLDWCRVWGPAMVQEVKHAAQIMGRIPTCAACLPVLSSSTFMSDNCQITVTRETPLKNSCTSGFILIK